MISCSKLSRLLILVVTLVGASAPAQAQEDKNKPYFLVATNKLTDSIFEESVVLMLPVTQSPIVEGIIINKPTEMPVKKLLPKADLKNQAATAYFGGPVDLTEPSVLIRASKAPGSANALLEDVYSMTDSTAIAHLLKNPAPAQDLRFFIGRSRWTEDQLRAETFEGSWYSMPAETSYVFSANPKSVWSTLVQRGQLQKARIEPRAFAEDFAMLTLDLSSYPH